jgi:hypothetical protein
MHPPIAEVDYPIDWNKIPIARIKQNLIPFFSKENLEYLYKQAVASGVETDEDVLDTMNRAANSSAKGYLPWWKTFRLEKRQLKGYLKQINDDLGFGLNENITFYWYPANVTLPMHVDIRSCSINLVLNTPVEGWDGSVCELAPLRFKEYGDFYYEQFVFDGLNNPHQVPIKWSERLTLQLAFFGVPYEEVRRRLEDNGLLTKSIR